MIVPFCTVFSLGYSWKVFEQDIVNESSHVTTRYMKMSKSLEDVHVHVHKCITEQAMNSTFYFKDLK